jgi:hypothetical protein
MSSRKKIAEKIICRINRALGNYKTPIWIVGDGRSGTTWVSEIINHSGWYRELFEPFHPYSIANFQRFHLNQYLRPTDVSNPLAPLLRSIFSGRFFHGRPKDRIPLALHKGLIVKDIFANLYMSWVLRNLPRVKTIFLIRNPFAVATSKRKLRDWFWMKDPKDFCTQKKLVDDFLSPHVDFLSQVGPLFLDRQLAIWSVLHYVPLKQLRSIEDVYILFYENLVLEPQKEIPRLLRYLSGRGSSDSGALNIEALAAKPSRLAVGDSLSRDHGPTVHSWKRSVTQEEIERGQTILRHFGLDGLYGGHSTPDSSVMAHLIASS